jgi:hypothetical protein
MPLILEGLVTTFDPDNAMHVAPMGPRVDPDMRRLLLRPFPTSQTFRNLRRHPEGVFHVTDDVLLLAQAAIGMIREPPEHRSAVAVRGHILTSACRAYEFRVTSCDDREERVRMQCEVVRAESLRDFFGFNRAKHAVVEAAILATRLHLIAPEVIDDEFRRLDVIVQKTGNGPECEALDLLRRYVAENRARAKP